MTDRWDDARGDARDSRGAQRDAEDRPHVIEDLAAGQGRSSAPDSLPPDDVMQLAGIRDAAGQGSAVAWSDEVDRLGEITDTAIYEGDLEARPRLGDQPDQPDAENIEMLLEEELRDGETDDAGVAAEEGLTWVPPTDPPVIAGDDGQPEVAAGFGVTADEEPFDADHHGESMWGEDERTERVIEALRAHAETTTLVDRLSIDTDGSRVLVAGRVDDLDDEDAILAVVSEVDGVTEVVNRIEVAGAE